jgi:UDPglucose 6-dehydrogenase
MREAPSIAIITALQDAGAEIVAYDPESMDAAKPLLPGISYASDAYSCIRGADALVIVTEWDAFRALDLAAVKAALREPVVVDLRNIYRSDDMRRRGFQYSNVGNA